MILPDKLEMPVCIPGSPIADTKLHRHDSSFRSLALVPNGYDSFARDSRSLMRNSYGSAYGKQKASSFLEAITSPYDGTYLLLRVGIVGKFFDAFPREQPHEESLERLILALRCSSTQLHAATQTCAKRLRKYLKRATTRKAGLRGIREESLNNPDSR